MGPLLTRSRPAARSRRHWLRRPRDCARATVTSSTSTLPPATSRPRRTSARGPEAESASCVTPRTASRRSACSASTTAASRRRCARASSSIIVDDASDGLGVTEAVIDWRPIPHSRNQHQLRFGAFYPSFSLENGDRGWQSPFTYSYSAINTWLGEEIRPIGAEWSLRRRFEGFRSNHELRAFAAGFYGNDPAGTLLFWRGWSLHDRQSRLGDELDDSAAAVHDEPAAAVAVRETDHRPGGYAGLEWRYAQRALVQVARYDNRADPYSFSDGQWGWGTDFNHLAVQVSLPAELGLIVQWMDGATEWLTAALPNGTRMPMSEYVHDEFESQFVMLTRRLGAKQRLALRYDTFSIERPAAVPVLYSDHGHAWTLSYRIEPTQRFSGGIEWLRIDSSRDLWPMYYATPHAANRRPAPAAVLLPPRRPARASRVSANRLGRRRGCVSPAGRGTSSNSSRRRCGGGGAPIEEPDWRRDRRRAEPCPFPEAVRMPNQRTRAQRRASRVVGIGASAGGIDALRHVLRRGSPRSRRRLRRRRALGARLRERARRDPRAQHEDERRRSSRPSAARAQAELRLRDRAGSQARDHADDDRRGFFQRFARAASGHRCVLPLARRKPRRRVRDRVFRAAAPTARSARAPSRKPAASCSCRTRTKRRTKRCRAPSSRPRLPTSSLPSPSSRRGSSSSYATGVVLAPLIREPRDESAESDEAAAAAHLRSRARTHGPRLHALQAADDPAAARAAHAAQSSRRLRALSRVAAREPPGDPGAVRRPADLRDDIFPRPGGVGSAAHARRRAARRARAGRRADPRLGAGLRDGRRGLYARDPVPRGDQPARHRLRARDLRLRRRSRRAGDGARRRVSARRSRPTSRRRGSRAISAPRATTTASRTRSATPSFSPSTACCATRRSRSCI